MPQYYPNQDVICWVKAFITEAYENADEDQQKCIRKDWKEFVQTKGGRYEVDKYKWAWNKIALSNGILDEFPCNFGVALYNSWEAAGFNCMNSNELVNDTSFSDELLDIFESDEKEYSCYHCGEDNEETDDTIEAMDGMFCSEKCLDKYIAEQRDCSARCENKGTIKIEKNGKECLVCEDCCDWFKNKPKVN
jgi:hypothetical protein